MLIYCYTYAQKLSSYINITTNCTLGLCLVNLGRQVVAGGLDVGSGGRILMSNIYIMKDCPYKIHIYLLIFWCFCFTKYNLMCSGSQTSLPLSLFFFNFFLGGRGGMGITDLYFTRMDRQWESAASKPQTRHAASTCRNSYTGWGRAHARGRGLGPSLPLLPFVFKQGNSLQMSLEEEYKPLVYRVWYLTKNFSQLVLGADKMSKTQHCCQIAQFRGGAGMPSKN